MIFFVSFSSNSGRHNSATKDFSSARDKRIEILFYEESFVTLHSHHAIMAIYSGGFRGRVGGGGGGGGAGGGGGGGVRG